MQEVRAYFLIIASAVGIITVNTVSLCGNALQAFQDAAFQVGSVITTTGYATVDFDNMAAAFKNDYGTFDVYRRLRGQYRRRYQGVARLDSA